MLQALVFLLASAIAFWFLFSRAKRIADRGTTPKGYRRVQPPSVLPSNMLEDTFKPAKVPEDLDAIFIGSGIGSLYAAALMAKTGKRVLVLEQHHVVGGCTHEFLKKGYSFDSGLHYGFQMLLDVASDPLRKVHWAQQGTTENGHVYDEICLGDEKPFAFPSGKENLLAALIREFPHEEQGLRKYFRMCEEVCRSSRMHFMLKIAPVWLHAWFEPLLCRRFHTQSHRTAQSVVDECVRDKRLAAILLGQFGDHGMLPDRASFFMQAAVFTHYFRGGYYPVGGPKVIAQALVPTIVGAGGRVLLRAPVAEILFSDSGNLALGVRLQSGLSITARAVVSGAGIRNTFMRLISPEHAARLALPLDALQKIGPSVAHVCIFVGLEGSSDELGLPSSNQWVLPVSAPDYDLCHGIRRFVADPLNPEVPVFAFLGFPSAKDPSARSNPRSTVSLINEARWDWFHPLAVPGSRKGKRGDAYKSEKERFQKRLVDLLCDRFPQCRDKIRYVVAATPLTTSHYLGAMDGESYGLNAPPERFSRAVGLLCRPQVAGAPNLFLCGQDIVSPGVSSAMIGGLLCAHSVLGYGTLSDILTGRNLIKDILSLSSSSSSS